MLLKNVIILLIFVPFRIFSSENLCRLIELNIPEGLLSFSTKNIEEKLFYKTDHICQNKPVFRSMKYENLYQFQSANNRLWTLYDTTNSTYRLGSREWCDVWNAKPLLAMPLGMFQHPLSKQTKLQRWKQVIIHQNNNSYGYKSIQNTYIKCYYPSSTPTCQTNQLAFLFDLTETTNKDEFDQMKLLTKTLIWLLFNQTNIALSYYSDTFHLLNSFDEKTAAKSFEHLFDSIDGINQNLESTKRFSVAWPNAIHSIVTTIFRRRFILPVQFNTTIDEVPSNDTSDEDIYTDPYPLIYNDDEAIKTVLNITEEFAREKRSLKTPYDKSKHVLVILTSRSKYLYDYQAQHKQLADFISTVPLRIVVIDFNNLSNRKLTESMHSAFIHHAKYALASSPVYYNYIETYEELGDALYDNQLFNNYHRLCYPPEENLFKNNFTTTLIETDHRSIVDCPILTLFNQQKKNSTLKEKFEYTFYETSDQCFSGFVYRSLSDRNLYVQRISNGQWLINRVDPLLPSIISLQQKRSLTTTSTLSPEFFYATDYASGPINDNSNVETETTMYHDLPISVPHCSDNPGLDALWKSIDADYSLRTSRQWVLNFDQSDFITPICNKYKISCQTTKLDLVIIIDSQDIYRSLIQTFLNTFISLIEASNHRISLYVLSSSTIDPFQYQIPFTSIDKMTTKMIENLLSYMDDKNTSTFPYNLHLQRISDYVQNNQEFSSNIPTQQVILTIPSRLNFNQTDMKDIIQRYSTIRYMVLDPYLKNDGKEYNNQEREKILSSLASSPSDINVFRSYAAYRDLTFHIIFRILESLCGYLQ